MIFTSTTKSLYARGGGHTLDNIRPACSRCNLSKRSRDVQDFADEWAQRLADEQIAAILAAEPGQENAA
ncbi:HNH endonuclease [Prescottella equi]|uniref:HNH endonuclease n=1 Tax=Rhodococcus hoagii TaxID=43767 RepID=UPI001C74FFA8|nr:HNH endonuclease [Prescottella equi]BCN45255.1 hypothetical protein RE9414_35350 [Prescottella equi]